MLYTQEKKFSVEKSDAWAIKNANQFMLCEQLQDLLVEMNLSNEEAANIMAVDQETFSKMEIGDFTVPSYKYEEALSILYFYKKNWAIRREKDRKLQAERTSKSKKKTKGKNVKNTDLKQEEKAKKSGRKEFTIRKRD